MVSEHHVGTFMRHHVGEILIGLAEQGRRKIDYIHPTTLHTSRNRDIVGEDRCVDVRLADDSRVRGVEAVEVLVWHGAEDGAKGPMQSRLFALGTMVRTRPAVFHLAVYFLTTLHALLHGAVTARVCQALSNRDPRLPGEDAKPHYFDGLLQPARRSEARKSVSMRVSFESVLRISALHDVDTGIGDFHCSPDFRSKVSILAKIDMTAPLFTVFGSHFGGARLVEAGLVG